MPYCPGCFQEREDDLARCPLDRSFYVESRCPRCSCEVLPREDYCGFCGSRLEGRRPDSLVRLEPASLGRRFLSLTLDLFALFLLVEMLSAAGWLGPLPGAALSAVAYYVILQSGGRQTFGQFVMGTIVLDSERRALTWKGALRRTVAAPLAWLGERWSGAREWRAPEA